MNRSGKYSTYAGSKEDFLKMFVKNKITVMATVRSYEDGNDFIKETKRDQNLLTQIRSISDLDSLADFTIVCGDREFKCHRVLLASRSTVFKAMILNDNFVEIRQNSITIEKTSPDMVEAMLEFISTGHVPDDIQEKAIDLIDLADSYDLQDLMEFCESSLINNLTVEGVLETLIAIDLHAPNSQNRQKIVAFIKEEAAEVVKSSHWNEFVIKYPDLDLITEIVLSLSLQTN